MTAGDQFFDQLDPAEQRQTTINWPGLVQRVVDDYRQQTVVPHGVQKDAVQNSWDARRSRRHATGWGCAFELYLGDEDHRYLTITDWGTSGLTGRVLTSEEYFADLPPDERWARFESLAFTHPEGATEGQLGARGQGKFIFVGASRTKRMLYDTLRDDGVYRLGVRTVEPTQSPVYYWEGEAAERNLVAYDASLERLERVGSRIVIDQPTEEVVTAILNGSFARAVAETWWPIIKKHHAEITVSVRSEGMPPERTVVVPPPEMDLPEEDNPRYDVWLREGRRIEYQGEHFGVKRLHIVRDKRGPVAADMQGVALFRGGMKVMALPMRHVPAEISESVYGYLELDRDLDDAMKRLEAPTHYSFDLGRGIGRKLRNFVDDELSRFAREKLGQGADPRAVEAERHHEAERRALAAINRAARDLGILGRTGLGGGRKPPSGGGPEQPLAAVLIPLTLPGGGRRIDYGEGFAASAFAKSRIAQDARVRLALYVTRGDQTVWSLADGEFKLEPESESEEMGHPAREFTVDEHEPGEYTLRAKLTLLRDAGELRKGHEHRAAFRFWLEQDPPEVGIFDDIEGLDYVDRPIDAEVVASERGGWKFQYNTSHPAKRREDQDEESLFDYLLRLMARELMYVDLRSDEPTQFVQDQLDRPDELYRHAGMVISKILYQYYG